MSKVLTFSRFFPAHHPKKGQPTYFVEKLWKGFEAIGFSEPHYFFSEYPEMSEVISGVAYNSAWAKHHTIRSGNRWKVGDKFSPRVWSGKPYQSKQIIIAPDIEIKKVWSFEITQTGIVYLNDKAIYDYKLLSDNQNPHKNYWSLCENDGLHYDDFDAWFKCGYQEITPFSGQIICWNESINY